LAIGLHPINNVVDISNFVLFELGQPLHTFDADKIAGGKVIVRRAAEGEKIVTLDGVERSLHANDMVIANAEGPMCIAGVFGGIDSGVTESTVNVFLESAYFDPGSIRKTSKSHGLQTDASFRYERGADPGIIPLAARRAALLIQELAGGHITGKVQVNYPQPIEKKVIDLDYDRIENFIGKKIGHDVIENILTWLSYDFIEKRQGGAKVAAPSYMIDVYRECDVVEEILRIYSYNNIELPHHMKMSVGTTPVPDPETVRNYISNFLAANGFNETMNNSLTKSAYYAGLETFPEERCVRIVNPLSADLNVLRQTLILNGLEVVAYNVNRQIGTLKTFEYGSVYQRLPETDGKTLASYEEHQCFTLLMSGSPARSWREGARKGSFYELKGYLELLLKRYAVDIFTLETKPAPSDIFAEGISYSLPGTHEPLAVIGTVSPALARKFDVRQPVFAAEICWQTLLKLVSRVKVKFQEMPKFPEVKRDLAVLIDENVAYADLCRAAQKSVKKILKQVSLFDVYRGDKIPEGKKQYAINFVLQDPEKTLTDQEVEKAMSRLLATFQNQFGAVLR
ncbi:MAG: phenylalanine--tRNA ligase subunit beta, partial [Candidatus Cryptobacteroides sp.]|nr:phenylalanine--tRNA ligase subunit beta [Candidatus Cryptobacteroides sp.]